MSIIDSAKKSRGRPNVDSEAVNVRLERAALTALDDWRRQQSDLPTRPEAVRRLVDAGMKDALPSPDHLTITAVPEAPRSFLALVVDHIRWMNAQEDPPQPTTGEEVAAYVKKVLYALDIHGYEKGSPLSEDAIVTALGGSDYVLAIDEWHKRVEDWKATRSKKKGERPAPPAIPAS
jgi:hypothetical protein